MPNKWVMREGAAEGLSERDGGSGSTLGATLIGGMHSDPNRMKVGVVDEALSW